LRDQEEKGRDLGDLTEPKPKPPKTIILTNENMGNSEVNIDDLL
jgi:hypothetical protein